MELMPSGGRHEAKSLGAKDCTCRSAPCVRCRLHTFRAKSFRPPSAAELLSLCVATSTQDACANSEAGPKGVGQDARSKEKDNQRERPPRLALAGPRATAPALPQLGHPCPRRARQVREPRPGFSIGLLSERKGVDIPVDSRYAACRPRLTAAQGPRVEQRAIVARTFQKSQGKSKKRRRRQPPALSEKSTQPQQI
jgi:hypothetical protein